MSVLEERWLLLLLPVVLAGSDDCVSHTHKRIHTRNNCL
jgi:hypothetical protein